MAENETDIPFDKLIAEDATVEIRLPNNEKRYFSGLINRLSEGTRGPVFTTYSADLVPKFWLLTRTARSRIFRTKLTVPEILEQVLSAISPRFEWDGKFAPRDYCVQYHETDFNFASRLMEEEGIYYFFEHLPNSHQMVVTNKLSHPEVAQPSEIVYKNMESGPPCPNNVYDWAKSQELRSSRYTMWDYTFQLPWNNLEAKADIVESESVGQVTHTLKVRANKDSEIYDFPGEYTQRFDAIDKDVSVCGSYMTTVGGSINFTNGGVDKNGNKFGDCKQLVNKDYHLHVKGDSFLLTDGEESHIVGGDALDWYRSSHRTTVANEEFLEAPTIIHEGGENISLKAPTIILDVSQKVSIKGPGGFIIIDPSGVTIQGGIVKINSVGGPPENAAPTSGIGSGPVGDKAKEPKDPTGADSSKPGQCSCGRNRRNS